MQYIWSRTKCTWFDERECDVNLVVISSLRFIFSKTFDDSEVVYAFIVKVTVATFGMLPSTTFIFSSERI